MQTKRGGLYPRPKVRGFTPSEDKNQLFFRERESLTYSPRINPGDS
jgi:hypothetical protein